MGIFGPKDVLFRGQNYSELRKKTLQNEALFKDPEFPPNDMSIWKDGSKMKDVEWKRPKDLCENPRLVSNGRIACHDLIQGELGNCWLVAACSCLAVNKAIWEQVVPDLKEQEINPEAPSTYAGIFHFRFWRYGYFTDVVIDDLLPCCNGKLIFMHSRTNNEFWCALLEKAYAKLYGSYDSLEGGELSEALEDFTGGVTELFDLSTQNYQDDFLKKEVFFSMLYRELENHALMAAAIPALTKEDMEKGTAMGFVMGHAYSVTAIKKIPLKGLSMFSFFSTEKISMIRLRNPWGAAEWKGAFGVGSDEWTRISEKERTSMGLTFEDDGEFWMKFEDFLTNFIHLSLCRTINQSFFSLSKRWFPTQFEGEWRYPERAGGCVNNTDTFLENPQYAFSMEEDEDFIIVLTQKPNEKGLKSVIGFTVMKVEENRAYRLHKAQTIVDSSIFKDSRSVVMKKETIVEGRYVIIPTLFSPKEEGSFLLRIYLGCNSKAFQLIFDMPQKSACPCLPMYRFPEHVTQITVLRARKLYRPECSTPNDIDSYLVLQCEGDKVISRVKRKNIDPEFNFSAIFYRRNPSVKPIIIDVWHKSVVDSHIGRLQVWETEKIDDKVRDLALTDRKDHATPSDTGYVVYSVSNSFNLKYF